MAGFISAERIEAGSIATSKLEPDAGNHLVISGNPSITQINNQIAPGFSTETSYVTGDLVMKDGIVYIFTSDHPAGAWDDSDVLATNVATQIELLPDKIIQYVGQQGYGRTFIQWTDPALDPDKNVAPGDYWIKQHSNTGTWQDAKTRTWGSVKDGTWYDLMNKMPEMYCRKGSGLEAEWVPVNDTKAISEAYTRIEQTQFAIIQEAYRANAAEGELSSKIIQTAEGILQEVRQEVSSGYIAKTSTYQTADAIVTTAEQYTASRLTNYYTKTETASQISTTLSSYTYSKGDLYTKANVYSKADVYTKTETASQVTTSISSYTYSKSDLYKKSEVYSKADVYTKTETASQISTSLSSYTYSKSSVYTKTETASQISTSISTSLGNYYTKTETATQISTYVGNHAYGLVSGITIDSNGITMTGSKHITISSSGYVELNYDNNSYGFIRAGEYTFSKLGFAWGKTIGDTYYNSDMSLNEFETGVYDYGLFVNSSPTAGKLNACLSAFGATVRLIASKFNFTGFSNSYFFGDINMLYTENKIRLLYDKGWVDGAIGSSSAIWSEAWINDLHYGELIATSSRDIKHNIQKIKSCGQIIDKLNAVTFVYNNDERNHIHSGLIYEDTVEVMPEICRYEDGIKSISYIELVPYLLKEIQELRKRVKQLER